MKIKMDDREQGMEIIMELSGFEVEKCRMNVGDYSFGNVLIERKSIDDFCSSILDGRMENQIEVMKKELWKYGKLCFLIVVGNIKDRKVNINENCILGKCVSLILKHNIKLLWCEDDFQFGYLLKNIYEKVSDKDEM